MRGFDLSTDLLKWKMYEEETTPPIRFHADLRGRVEPPFENISIESLNLALNDLVTAMVNLVDNKEALGKVFNLAGGKSWQVSGKEYARRYCETLEISFDSQTYYEKPGWLDWYDTAESQAILEYQNTSFDDFHVMLRAAMEEAME